MPVRIPACPLNSHSLKYFFAVSLRSNLMSLLLKSSSSIHDGMAFADLWERTNLKSESLGMSGYTLARESRAAALLRDLSRVFRCASASIFESVRITRLSSVTYVILRFWFASESIGIVGCPGFGRIWNEFFVFSSLMLVPSESFS